jgi:hypothetical protein
MKEKRLRKILAITSQVFGRSSIFPGWVDQDQKDAPDNWLEIAGGQIFLLKRFNSPKRL